MVCVQDYTTKAPHITGRSSSLILSSIRLFQTSLADDDVAQNECTCTVRLTRTRYMDDTFVLWPHNTDQLEDFHAHLNKQHPQIHFTKEEENDNQINFLDVLVKKENGRFKTTVYRKPNVYPHGQVHSFCVTPSSTSEIWNNLMLDGTNEEDLPG
jgi:hypothetical protein